jgi:hypothetical protein
VKRHKEPFARQHWLAEPIGSRPARTC